MKRIALALLASTLLVACGAEDLAWRQEVPLHDGRIVVLDRRSHIGPRAPLMQNLRMETEQMLAFTHPDTGQRIEWKIPDGLQPYVLDFEAGVPYYVFYAHTVADYNDWECPNPPYMVFKYVSGQWQRIPFEELPARFVKPNLMPMAKSYERFIVNGHVTQEALHGYFKQSPKEYQVIGREKVNPIVHGCHGDVLVKQGRQSEIDYGR
jgi:hypothetical protein